MRLVRQGVMLVSVMLAMLCGHAGGQTLATTAIADTVYSADGTPAAGTVVVSWNQFTTATGTVVPAGTTTVTLGAGGALSLSLVPNAQANPMGSYYTAVFHRSDGTSSRQYWVVPAVVAGAAPVKLAAIENQVLPLSVAMQTVSKQYVDTAIAETQSAVQSADRSDADADIGAALAAYPIASAAAAPAGTCTAGTWVFSQDGRQTWCDAGSYVTLPPQRFSFSFGFLQLYIGYGTDALSIMDVASGTSVTFTDLLVRVRAAGTGCTTNPTLLLQGIDSGTVYATVNLSSVSVGSVHYPISATVAGPESLYIAVINTACSAPPYVTIGSAYKMTGAL